MHVYLCVSIYDHGCRYLKKPEEGIQSSGAEVTGDCKLPDAAAGN